MGFLGAPNPDINNMWLDGTGHMACAYQATGETARGWFYSNQLDSLLIEYQLKGRTVRSLPYTINRSGDYSWVDTTKGFVSAACWYIFAKNGFNPMDFDGIPNGINSPNENESITFKLYAPYPNPFFVNNRMQIELLCNTQVELSVCDLMGRKIRNLMHGWYETGDYWAEWDGCDGNGMAMPTGIYFYEIQCGNQSKTIRVARLR